MRAKISDKFELCKKTGIKAGDGKKTGLYPLFTSSNEQKLFADSYQFDFDAVIIGTGGCPSCNFGIGKYSVSSENIVLKPNSDVLPKFLYYFLRKNDFAVLENGFHGSGLKHISSKYVMNIEFDYPDIEAQKKIVSELDDIQKYIKGTKTKILLCDELVKSRFNEMFGTPGINQKHYPEVPLSNLLVSGLSYGSLASAVEFDGKTRYIRITDIQDDGTLISEAKSPSQYDERYLLKDGDILFARSGATVGKTFLYSSKIGKAIFAGYLIKGTPNKEIVLPEYLFAYTKTPFYRDFIENTHTAVAQPNVNAKQYGSLNVLLPPLAEQTKFVSFVNEIGKLKLNLRSEAFLAEELFTAKMNRYF